MKQAMTLTVAQSHALHYVGRNEKNGVKVGRRLSQYLLDRLKEKGFAMEYDGIVFLTAQGRQEYSNIQCAVKKKAH